MTRPTLWLVLGGVLLAAPLQAQRSPLSLDVSLGANREAQRGALSIWYPLLRLWRLRLGLGGRASVYTGDPANYTIRGDAVAGRPASLAIDPAVYSLNGGVFGELGLGDRVALGANLDVLGVAAGPRRVAGSLSAKPPTLSTFRYGSADRGALNSEFFVSVRVADRVRVRAGMSHYVTDYQVTETAAPGVSPSRYLKFQSVPFAAVAFGW